MERYYLNNVVNPAGNELDFDMVAEMMMNPKRQCLLYTSLETAIKACWVYGFDTIITVVT